jgi:hypothetical protein
MRIDVCVYAPLISLCPQVAVVCAGGSHCDKQQAVANAQTGVAEVCTAQSTDCPQQLPPEVALCQPLLRALAALPCGAFSERAAGLLEASREQLAASQVETDEADAAVQQAAQVCVLGLMDGWKHGWMNVLRQDC